MAFDVFEQFATDETLELEGVWQPVGGGAAEVLVARSGNKKHSRLLSREVEKNQAALDAKTDEADKLSDQIMADVMAQTILLGWRTPQKDGAAPLPTLRFKGDDLPYSVANARTLLAVKDFRALIGRLSNEMEKYKLVREEQAAKN
jgi:hypothetical protein